jgi:hypothetical protein
MFGMVKYLSQFVLQMLPSITATVVGAYIVATYINPRTPPESARTAAQTQQASKPAAAKAASGDAGPAASAEQAAIQPAAKPADDKPVEAAERTEKPKPVKGATAPAAASADVRMISLAKPAAGEAQSQVSSPALPQAQPAATEARSANDLVRAAIQRLRSTPETKPETKEASRSEESVRTAPLPRAPQQVRLAPEPQPQTNAPAMIPASAPPLPPAIDIAAPRYPQTDEVTASAADPERARDPGRLTPPVDVPMRAARAPLDLRATNTASNSATNDDFFSATLTATKSLLRAITPN